MQNDSFLTAHLDDRRLIRVSGGDAMAFLQNVMTNDMRALMPGGLLYSCLLTPQGQFLHDFLVRHDEGGGGYLLDCEAARADDLLRRLNVFKLRARVSLTDTGDIFSIYAVIGNHLTEGYIDPRHPALGQRLYASRKIETAVSAEAYYDFCISLGIPSGSRTIRPEKDILADVNLDLLNAVAWDKGCFIGQEVTARMRYRGLARKRLMIVTGSGLAAGGSLLLNGQDMGDIRQVSSTGGAALAVLKLSVLGQPGILTQEQIPVTVQAPEYINLSASI